MIPTQVRLFHALNFEVLDDLTLMPSSAIPEVSKGVDAVITAFNKLPHSSIDRSLVLPLALVGCLAGLPEQRQAALARLALRDEAIGNISSARLLIERVWNVRSLHGNAVDWRDVLLGNMQVQLLLI